MNTSYSAFGFLDRSDDVRISTSSFLTRCKSLTVYWPLAANFYLSEHLPDLAVWIVNSCQRIPQLVCRDLSVYGPGVPKCVFSRQAISGKGCPYQSSLRHYVLPGEYCERSAEILRTQKAYRQLWYHGMAACRVYVSKTSSRPSIGNIRYR